MSKLIFKKESDAQSFASELLKAHDKTQICYKYERDYEIEFWWEYQTDMTSDARLDEEDEKREVCDKLFRFLEENEIAKRLLSV